MAAATAVTLSRKSHDGLIKYYKNLQELQNVSRSTSRARYEEVDREYQREVDATKEQADAKAANRAGDSTRQQNVTIPVVMPQVEAAVTYQSSVFLTGHPMFGVVSGPKYIDEALQIESKIEEDSIRNGWTRHFMMSFRHGFKYNFAPIEVSWAQEVTATVETDITKSVTQGIPKEVIWSGNKVRALDPYNTFVDTRVPATEVYKDGEFAGFTEFMSRIKLKKFISELPDVITANVTPAFNSGTAGNAGAAIDSGAMNYYTPSINPEVDRDSLAAGGTNWMSWAGLSETRNKNIEYKDGYEVTTLYCRILPSDFELKVPKSNTPQVYKLILINHQVIIYAERQTNAHNYLPIVVGAPLEDGLSYQTKSLAENGVPFQQAATSLMAANMASKRRAISDRVLYDPSRITSAHINSANPSAKIPVRPAAYGKNLSESVYAFPYRDDQSANNMQQISSLIGLANGLSGQNQAQQGQFVKGNKTVHEFESVMQNANGRDQLASILLEAQSFTPIKHVIKLNILQYQGGTTIYNRDKDVEVEIDPVALRKAVVDFKVSDGLTPASKLLNSDTYATTIQVLGSSPQIAQGYNIAPLFSYFMKTQGSSISEFEKSQPQLAYEQAMGQWQQMGMTSLEKGIEFKAPQPLPKDFGYDPAANKPSPEEAAQKQGERSASVLDETAATATDNPET